VSAHVAAWIPFLSAVAASWRGRWRAVGDGAHIAWWSWQAFTAQGSLVGQRTELARGLHDLGPLEYWLLAAPVHIDPVRGALWGAALCCMAAASLAIEAAWSVAGKVGGLLMSGAVLGITAWMPGIAIRPYWNPFFGAVFFLAALAAGWAVMSGRRGWWPVLVITASVAAQAHLMFAVASAAVTLAALIVGLADGFRAKAGCKWVVTGLIAGVACWSAPLDQQVTSPTGNLTALLHAQGAGQRTGLYFGLKTLTAFTEPPPLWWHPNLGHRASLYGLIDDRPAVFAVAVLAITAAALFAAVVWLRSRQLASLAVISLLVSAAALVTFSGIPVTHDDLSRLAYLITVMFPVGLLTWLTVGWAAVLTGRRVISRLRAISRQRATAAGHPEPPGGRRGTVLARWAARGAGAVAAPLLLLASVPILAQVAPVFPGDATRSAEVGVATRLIKQDLPGQRVFVLVTGSTRPNRYRVIQGVAWALDSSGYDPLIVQSARRLPIAHVAVLLRGDQVTVKVTRRP
jgi:hypothetical protein